MKLEKSYCKTEKRRNFFSQRIVQKWNSLSPEVISATSVDNFKNKLDKEWSNNESKYNFLSEWFQAGRS